MIDNLKAQVHTTLTTLLDHLTLYSQESQSNPEASPTKLKCKQIIQLYSQNLNPKDKMLVQLTFANDLEHQMNLQQFKAKIVKILGQINIDSNEFNISQTELVSKNVFSKTIKMKGVDRNATKKTEPNVESHPQYFRVDMQICNRLFQHYKSLALGVPKDGTFNFEQKEHHKISMNYHKIIQIFKDVGIELTINQKLLILRSIKKFCFNQNFINMQQFAKVFKVIVHGLGYKQQIFQDYIKKIYAEKEESTKKTKSSSTNKPSVRRNYRFKTDNTATSEYKNQSFHANSHNSNKTIIDLSQCKQSNVFSRKNTERQNKVHSIKNIENSSYLVKAIQNQKVSKVTWDSLFNMKESAMHNYIIIPSFIKDLSNDQIV